MCKYVQNNLGVFVESYIVAHVMLFFFLHASFTEPITIKHWHLKINFSGGNFQKCLSLYFCLLQSKTKHTLSFLLFIS